MSFTDEQIAFLKRDMKDWCKDEKEMMEALLARLETAEVCIAECSLTCEGYEIQETEEYKAWRKAAGK